jgi:hypothetical protein
MCGVVPDLSMNHSGLTIGQVDRSIFKVEEYFVQSYFSRPIPQSHDG